MPELALPCLRRLVRIDGARHATVVSAQALASLIPLVVVVAIFTPGKVALFADSGEVESGLTWVSVLVLALATLWLVGAAQRIFQRAYGQEPGGITDAPLRSAYLAGGALWIAIESPLRLALEGAGGVVFAVTLGSATGGVVWLWMPLVLLHVKDWRRLMPGALLFGVLGTSLAITSDIYVPILTARSVERYGLIGIAVTFQSWLLVFTSVILIGAVVARDRNRWRALALDRSPVLHGGRCVARSRVGHLRADSGLLSRAIRSHRHRLHAPAGAARVRIRDRDRRRRVRCGHRGVAP
jgi:hypothetical protein